ncbi:hypothetical protein OAP92_04940 [Flavobacteriaceae bacterium]|nr:hypothetical protein [Flavobacteriaceae bacterium]MDC3297459.1 hypothetical protein [Flavobacteriaceae bacterium]
MKSNPYLTVLTIVFGLQALYFFIEIDELLYLTLIVSLISILSYKFSKAVEKIWFGLAFFLSQIIPNILLTIIFYLILTPLSLLSKLFRAKTDFESLNNKETLYRSKLREFKKESFKRTW